MKPPKPKSKCHEFNFGLLLNLGREKRHGLKNVLRFMHIFTNVQ